jgi:hypothetical protein
MSWSCSSPASLSVSKCACAPADAVDSADVLDSTFTGIALPKAYLRKSWLSLTVLLVRACRVVVSR